MNILLSTLAFLSVFYVSSAYALPPIYPAEDTTWGGLGETPATETVQCLCKGITQNSLYYIGDVTNDSDEYYYNTVYDCVEYIANAYAASVFQTGFFDGVTSLYDYFADPSKIIVIKNNKYYCSIPLKVQRRIAKSGPAPVDCTSLNYSQAIPDITVTSEKNGFTKNHTLSTPAVQMSCSAPIYP